MITSDGIRVTRRTKTTVPKLEVNLSVALPRRLDLRKPIQSVLASLLVFSVLLPVLESALLHQRYIIHAAGKPLLSAPAQHLLDKLKYDEQGKVYRFNEEAKQKQQGSSVEAGAGKYAADLYKDAASGIAIYDPASQLSVKFTPQFQTLDGQEKDGHIIYPLIDGKSQLVYTIKGNGLKEDILLTRPIGDKASFAYKLELGENLEARLQDDGSLGVFSADAALHGNISFGSAEDQAAVAAARKNSQKSNLVFAIPAPTVTDSSGKETTEGVRFTYASGILTVVAEGLKGLQYPLAIDPSFVVTSANDWGKGNNDSNIEFDTAGGQIKRAGLTGGTIQSWGNETPLPDAIFAHSSVIHNGYLYIIGGCGAGSCATALDTITYTKINSSGAFSNPGCGSVWCTTTSIPAERRQAAVVVYNGYIYVTGGVNAVGSNLATVFVGRFNSDGTISSWNTTSSLTVARNLHGAAVAQGYIYVAGGVISGVTNSVEYATIRPDGSLSAWAGTSGMTGSRQVSNSVIAYNGRIYAVGGYDGSVATALVDYATIKSDGTLTSWAALSSLVTGRAAASVAVYSGYIYVTGGANTASLFATAEYAQVNGDGSLGAWATTTSFNTARSSSPALAYNGYIYIIGGCTTSAGFVCSAVTANTQKTKINPPGVLATNFSTLSGTFGTARYTATMVVYNKNLYMVGGCRITGNAECSTGTTSNISTEVNRALIQTDGTLSSWSSTTAMPNQAFLSGVFALDGYMYVIGGRHYDVLGGPVYDCTVMYAPINGSSGAIGTWSTSATRFDGSSGVCTDARSNISTNTVYNSRIYMIGGVNSSGIVQSSIYYADPDTNGDITAWTKQNNITQIGFGGGTWGGAHYPSMATSGNKIYVAGAYGATPSNKFGWFTINENGSVASITVSSTDLPTNLAGNGIAIHNGYIYYYAGCTTDCTTLADTTVRYGKLLTSGDVAADSGCGTSWCTSNSFTTARYGVGSALHNGRLYMAGGCKATNPSSSCNTALNMMNDVQVVDINHGGTGHNYDAIVAGDYATYRADTCLVGAGDYLYAIGGRTLSPFANVGTVDRALLGSDGAPGTWSTLPGTLSVPRHTAKCIFYAGYLYLIGGDTSSGGGVSSSVESAKVNADGTLGAWTQVSTSMAGRSRAGMGVHNGRLYMIGGVNVSGHSNTVEYASLLPGGKIGGWQAATVPPNSGLPRSGWIAGGYVFASEISESGTPTNRVLSAPISANGSLGSWAQTTQLPQDSSVKLMLPANGYIYFYWDSKNYKAPILSGGMLGVWEEANSFGASISRYGSTVYRGAIYATGGGDASTPSIFYKLNSIARSASYSRLLDFDVDVSPARLLVNGAVSASLDIKTATSGGNSFSAPKGQGFTPGSLQNIVDTDGGTGRWWLFKYDLDETSSAVFPDIPGNLTDFTFWYHPNPVRRLRGGKTFTGGAQQSLDAAP